MTVRAVAQVREFDSEITGVRPRTSAVVQIPSTASPYALARNLFKSGDAEGALRVLEREVTAGRESAETLRLIARAALQLGDEARAQQALERAIVVAPDDVVSHIRLARVLLRSGDASQATSR